MKLAVLGLDCAAPQLVFDQFRKDLPASVRPHGGRPLRRAGEHASADHRARLVVHDVEPRPRRAGFLRLSQPQGLFLRRLRPGQLHGRPRAADLGLPRARRGCARSCSGVPADVSAPAHPRGDGHLLPDALDRVRVHLSAVPQGRGRARVGRLHPGRGRLPHGEQAGHPRPDLRDDAAALQDRQAPAPPPRLGLLHDGGDGRRSHPSRLLEVPRPDASQVRAREPLRGRHPRATTGTSTARSARSSPCCPPTARSWSSPTTAPRRWWGASASTSG